MPATITLTDDAVAAAALQLPRDRKASLAHQLLESLEGCAAPEITDLWKEEVKQRINSVERGEEVLGPMEDALAEARAVCK